MQRLIVTLASIIFCSSTLCSADDADTLAEIKKTLGDIASFQQGDNPTPLVNLEKKIFQIDVKSPLRDSVEAVIIEILTGDSSTDARKFLCEQLRVIGTEKSISALASQLTDPDVSHLAQRALARMPFPAAAMAMHQSLGNATGPVKVGLIHSLGDLRYAAATADIAELTGNADKRIARAAIIALGRIGNDAAVKKLRSLTDGDNARIANHALLQCADQYATAGDQVRAEAIYRRFYDNADLAQMKLAGLRGIVVGCRSDPDLLVEAIKQGSLQRDAIALAAVAQRDNHSLTESIAAALNALDDDAKVLLLRALAIRGDGVAAKEAISLATTGGESVQLAAIEALGQIGNLDSVETLLVSAAEPGDIGKVAQFALKRLSADGTDAKLSTYFDHRNESLATAAIRAVASRSGSDAIPSLLAAANSSKESIRSEAINALGKVATADDLKDLFQLASKLAAESDSSLIFEAIGNTIRRSNSRQVEKTVISLIDSAPSQTQKELLPTLAPLGTPSALTRVRKAASHKDAAMQAAAIATLSRWPTSEAIGDLSKMVQKTNGGELRKQALDGFVRLAAVADDSEKQFANMVHQLQRIDERKMVLAAMGQSNADSREALDTAMSFLSDAPLQATAGLAALRIANRLRRSNSETARDALTRVIATVSNTDVRDRAQEVLNEIERYDDHILQWVGAGPYTIKGSAGGEAVYQTAFAPESEDADIEWKPITDGLSDWSINLENTYGGLDYAAAYLRTRVWSPKSTIARLEMGADDAVRAWVGGQVVYERWTNGGVTPRQYRANVQLTEGWNDLMLKVVDNEGGWGFAARLRDADGNSLKGIRVEAPSSESKLGGARSSGDRSASD